MFTGLIQHIGSISSIDKSSNPWKIKVQSNMLNYVLGESIAVDGICLTVTKFDDNSFSCDIAQMTQDVTTISSWNVGKKVNLERAICANQPFGGHFVTGHIDACVRVASIEWVGECLAIAFDSISSEFQKIITPKGSISLNGVSLTINTISDTGFTVMLIPETLNRTNLGNLAIGNFANIEYDMLAKMVCEQIKNMNLSKV